MRAIGLHRPAPALPARRAVRDAAAVEPGRPDRPRTAPGARTVRLRKALKLYMRHVLALAAMIVIALAVAGYVTTHQRLRYTWEHQRTKCAEISNAQAVTPGQGQAVNVAGVE